MRIDPKDPKTWPEWGQYFWYQHGQDGQFQRGMASGDMDWPHENCMRNIETLFGRMTMSCLFGSMRGLVTTWYPCDRDGWIKAEDGLPELGQRIIFANVGGGYDEMQVYGNDGTYMTHWQPAPPMPREEVMR